MRKTKKNLEPPATSATPQGKLGGTCITKNNTLSSKISKRQCKNKKQKSIEKNKQNKNLEPPATSATPQKGLGGTSITKNKTLSPKTSKIQCKNTNQTKTNKQNIEKNKNNKKIGASSHLSHSPEVAWRDTHNKKQHT